SRVAGQIERVANRLLRRPLEARVDRRVDLEPTGADGAGAVLRDQLIADVAEEVRLPDLLVEPARLQTEPAADGPLVLLLRDVALVPERLQDLVAARSRDLLALERVVDARRLR